MRIWSQQSFPRSRRQVYRFVCSTSRMATKLVGSSFLSMSTFRLPSELRWWKTGSFALTAQQVSTCLPIYSYRSTFLTLSTPSEFIFLQWCPLRLSVICLTIACIRSEVSPITRIFASPRAFHVEGFTQTRLGIASRDCIRRSRFHIRIIPLQSFPLRDVLTSFVSTVSDGLGQLVVLPRRALNPFSPRPSTATKSKGTGHHPLEYLPTAKVLGRAQEVSPLLSSFSFTLSVCLLY